MLRNAHDRYAHCPNVGHTVSLDQREGQCRDKNKCDDSRCPLEGQFEKDGLKTVLGLLASAMTGKPDSLSG